MPIYEFGSFILNTAERRLTRDGQAVAITGKAFDVLDSLVLKSGSLVLKDELLRTVWPNSVVEENNLTVTVAALRKALGDEYEVKKYIETVPGHGYRFVAKVRDVQHRDIYSLAVLPFAKRYAEALLTFTSVKLVVFTLRRLGKTVGRSRRQHVPHASAHAS